MAEGHLQIEKEVVHVIVKRCHNLNRLLVGLEPSHEENARPIAVGPTRLVGGDVKQASLFPEARNFK